MAILKNEIAVNRKTTGGVETFQGDPGVRHR